MSGGQVTSDGATASLPIRFAAVGLNHGHIYGQVDLLLEAGAELARVHSEEEDLQAAFLDRYPQAQPVDRFEEILEDRSIDLVVSAAVPCRRAYIGVAAMKHGKDFMSDKPAFTSLADLAEARRVQSETGRIFSVCFSERLRSRATVQAATLARRGAIGRVVQTIGLGPHRIRLNTRPDWFFDRGQYGGILVDIASHQIDQFLVFTGSTEAEIVAAQVANYRYPQYPGLDDFGEILLRGNGGTGYVRVDWYTPDGLEAWGDTRLFILGTEGTIEIRKNCDLCGREGGDHLFLVDGGGTQRIDCSDVDMPYGRRLLADIRERTETAMPQAHAFLVSELALKAQAMAAKLGHLR